VTPQIEISCFVASLFVALILVFMEITLIFAREAPLLYDPLVLRGQLPSRVPPCCVVSFQIVTPPPFFFPLVSVCEPVATAGVRTLLLSDGASNVHVSTWPLYDGQLAPPKKVYFSECLLLSYTTSTMLAPRCPMTCKSFYSPSACWFSLAEHRPLAHWWVPRPGLSYA